MNKNEKKPANNFLMRFAMDHPIVTFLIVETAASAVRGIVGTVCNTIAYKAYAETFPVNNDIEMPNWLKKENTDEQTEPEHESDED